MFSKKQQPQEPEMIELKELSSTGVETSDVKITTNNRAFEWQEESYPEIRQLHKQFSEIEAEPVRKAPPKQPEPPKPQTPIQQPPSQPPNSQIKMNGMTFNKNGKPIPRGNDQPQRPGIPPMAVSCHFCTYKQMVAGNSHVFICCMCNNMCQCRPVYNIFVCYGCHKQVCYQLGVSQTIRCSRCQCVNKVPLFINPSHSRQFSYENQVQAYTDLTANSYMNLYKDQIDQKNRQEIEIKEERAASNPYGQQPKPYVQPSQQKTQPPPVSTQRKEPQKVPQPKKELPKPTKQEYVPVPTEQINMYENIDIDEVDRHRSETRVFQPKVELLQFDDDWRDDLSMNNNLISNKAFPNKNL